MQSFKSFGSLIRVRIFPTSFLVPLSFENRDKLATHLRNAAFRAFKVREPAEFAASRVEEGIVDSARVRPFTSHVGFYWQ